MVLKSRLWCVSGRVCYLVSTTRNEVRPQLNIRPPDAEQFCVIVFELTFLLKILKARQVPESPGTNNSFGILLHILSLNYATKTSCYLSRCANDVLSSVSIFLRVNVTVILVHIVT